MDFRCGTCHTDRCKSFNEPDDTQKEMKSEFKLIIKYKDGQNAVKFSFLVSGFAVQKLSKIGIKLSIARI